MADVVSSRVQREQVGEQRLARPISYSGGIVFLRESGGGPGSSSGGDYTIPRATERIPSIIVKTMEQPCVATGKSRRNWDLDGQTGANKEFESVLRSKSK